MTAAVRASPDELHPLAQHFVVRVLPDRLERHGLTLDRDVGHSITLDAPDMVMVLGSTIISALVSSKFYPLDDAVL